MWLLVIVLAALMLAACGDSPTPPQAGADVRPASTLITDRHARNTCTRQSGADFPGAFTSARNFVHGPLVLIGGAYTDPATVREFGGNKFPLLVRPGHTVTMAIAPKARRFARLAYGPLPQGETKLRDAYTSATFIPCRRGKSISRADGKEVTFWSGFVLTRRPVCLPLDIAIDDSPPRRVGLALGARC
jgi:hypothetical protein